MESYKQKRGDTFSLAGPGTLPAGTWTATSQVRRKSSGTLVDPLVVVLTAQVSGSYTHLLSLSKGAAATILWPIEELECDVEFRDATGIVRSTQTFTIKVVKDITHA